MLRCLCGIWFCLLQSGLEYFVRQNPSEPTYTAGAALKAYVAIAVAIRYDRPLKCSRVKKSWLGSSELHPVSTGHRR